MPSALHRRQWREQALACARGHGSIYMADGDGDGDADSDDARTLRPLRGRRVALQAAPGQWPGPSPGTNSPLDCLCPGSAYRIAFGPRAGQKVLTLQGAMPRKPSVKQDLCADMEGFSLHAAVRCGADDRQLEQLRRTITRPAQDRRTGAMQRGGAGGAEAENKVSEETCTQVMSKLRRPGATAPRTW